jgi:hypothetical protein
MDLTRPTNRGFTMESNCVRLWELAVAFLLTLLTSPVCVAQVNTVLLPYGDSECHQMTPRYDSGSSPTITLSPALDYYGKEYSTLYVSTRIL